MLKRMILVSIGLFADDYGFRYLGECCNGIRVRKHVRNKLGNFTWLGVRQSIVKLREKVLFHFL